MNFYRRFIPHEASLLQPLHVLLSKSSPKELVWSESATAAFSAIKDALAQATLLVHPKVGAPTSIMTDASSTAVGAVLQQFIDGQWQPLAYFSKNLKPAETRYSAYDRELLAIYMAIKLFRYFIKGRQFYILTDHKPLTFALAKKLDRSSPRQARHLDFISQFTTDIRHVSGAGNTVADALSRLSVNAIHTWASVSVVDFGAMAAAQAEDPGVQTARTDSSLKLEQVPLSTPDGTALLCDVSTGLQRPVVPEKFRRTIFDALHSLSHPGMRATQRLVTRHFVWPGVNKDVRQWTRACMQCQRAKVHRYPRAPPGTFSTPDARFDHVHVDIVGPLPPSQGYTYLLTCVDRFTRWPEAVPIQNIAAETVAQAFIATWVTRFGTPSTVTTDRGSQFQSHLWTAFTGLLGTKHLRTTAYHPCANGLVERLHRQLKGALKGHPQQQRWTEALPLVLLGIRTSLKEDIGCTTAELVYGTTLRLPGAFFSAQPINNDQSGYVADLRNRMSSLKATPPRPLPESTVDVSRALQDATHVFIRQDAVRKPLQPPYKGPYKVLDRSSHYFTVDVNGHTDTITLNRLKPAYTNNSLCLDTSTSSQSPTCTYTPPPPPLQPSSETTASSEHVFNDSHPTRTTRSGRRVHWPSHLADYAL